MLKSSFRAASKTRGLHQDVATLVAPLSGRVLRARMPIAVTINRGKTR